MQYREKVITAVKQIKLCEPFCSRVFNKRERRVNKFWQVIRRVQAPKQKKECLKSDEHIQVIYNTQWLPSGEGVICFNDHGLLSRHTAAQLDSVMISFELVYNRVLHVHVPPHVHYLSCLSNLFKFFAQCLCWLVNQRGNL